MTQQFFTVLTNVGAAALANSISLGQDLAITSFAVGDGGGAAYSPTVEQLKAATDLVNKTYSGAVNELKKDPDNPARFYIEGVVPVDKGGWTVREAGWYLANGELFAITKFPPSYKSVPADGAATELPVRTYIATGAVDNVVLKIDPTIVMASRSYVDSEIAKQKVVADAALAAHVHKSLLKNPQNNHLVVNGAEHQTFVFDDGVTKNINVDVSKLSVGNVIELQKNAAAGRLDITRTDGLIDVRGGIAEANHYLPEGKVGTLFFECIAVGKLLFKGGY
jgi:phage-related tail fiber protein